MNTTEFPKRKYMVPVFLITRYECFVEAGSIEEAERLARYTDTEDWVEDQDYCDTEFYPASLVEEE